MPVSGKEIASLDFANLIGGPLNAVVEAQAKSAITTANFIKQVGFDENGVIKNVDFTYNRKNEEGKDQFFTLTVPFLTMLPVPYITVQSAVVEFNAKITSMTTSNVDDKLNTEAGLEIGGGAGALNWGFSAKLQSKVSYQRKTATSDKEERTFDMKVRVEAKNQDMPAGTERLLTLLENSIAERNGGPQEPVSGVLADGTDPTIIGYDDTKLKGLDAKDVARLEGKKIQVLDSTNKSKGEFLVKSVDATAKKITLATPLPEGPKGLTFKARVEPKSAT